MSSLLKNLLIALGLAILVLLAYMLFFRGGDEALLTESSGALSAQGELETQALLAMTQRLDAIDIDGKIFTDNRFTSLKDFRIELVSEPVGRQNPFAPIR